jgi:ATP-binding cassette subfamily C protein
MKKLFSDVWRQNAKGFLLILLLDIAVALTGSISVVMLVPMLDLLDISVGDSGALHKLLQPFATMPYLQRAIVIISIFVILLLVRAILNRFAAIRKNEFLERYEKNMRQQLYSGITEAHWEMLSGKKHTDLVNLMVTQTRQVRFCLQWMIGLIVSAVSAAMQLTIACFMSLPVTVMVLLVGAVFLWLFLPFQKRSRSYGDQAVEAARALHREIRNQLGGIKEIRAYGVEQEQALVFDQISQENYDAGLKLTQLRVRPQLLYSVAAAVLIAFAFAVSVIVLDTGTAQLVVMVYIFSKLWPMFSSMQGQMQNIQSYLPAYDKIQETLQQLAVEKDHPVAAVKTMDFCRQVLFQNVSFRYRNGQGEVLSDVCFELPFGSVTALVGRNGAGKSTTADLLLGLLTPTAGEILVDDVPLSTENIRAWRSCIGYVPQDPLILDATIRENLLRFHPQATEEDMIRALKQAMAWTFVEKLEKGLDTVLGTKGLGLSGGERQRIVLARVLMGKPKLIILDEATSALDYENETVIRSLIRSLAGETTVLLIAHRLSTIRDADRAVVLEKGKVVECGAMNQLLQVADGYLARMISVE